MPAAVQISAPRPSPLLRHSKVHSSRLDRHTTQFLITHVVLKAPAITTRNTAVHLQFHNYISSRVLMTQNREYTHAPRSSYKDVPANSRCPAGSRERLFVWFYDYSAFGNSDQLPACLARHEGKPCPGSSNSGFAACRLKKHFSHLHI